MKTFSFINKKGGVGKTTITVNLAYAIAESCDLRVLVIDNDDQGNDSQFFDADPEKSLTDVLLNKANIQDVIQPTRYSNIEMRQQKFCRRRYLHCEQQQRRCSPLPMTYLPWSGSNV